MIAQDLVVKHPDLVRKLVLTGTGPRGGKDMDKVVGVTYWDTFRAAVTFSDPKEFLFFNRDDKGKRAARHSSSGSRNAPRTGTRRSSLRVPDPAEGDLKYGRSTPSDLSVITQPTLIANGDNDRMVPSVLSEDLHQRIAGELIIYPNSGTAASSSTTRIRLAAAKFLAP